MKYFVEYVTSNGLLFPPLRKFRNVEAIGGMFYKKREDAIRRAAQLGSYIIIDV